MNAIEMLEAMGLGHDVALMALARKHGAYVTLANDAAKQLPSAIIARDVAEGCNGSGIAQAAATLARYQGIVDALAMAIHECVAAVRGVCLITAAEEIANVCKGAR